MGVIIYNGVSSEELGIVVEHPPNYEIAKRRYETIQVPGRNGDIIIDNNCFDNVDRTYDIAIGQEGGDFTVFASRMADWLSAGSGYCRLEDTYEPDYYKMAVMSDPGEVINILQQAGRTTVTFNRRPERFLKMGERFVEVYNGSILTNPTKYTAKPIIEVSGKGSGSITVGRRTIEIENIVNSITIDSELQEAYSDGVNQNGNIIAPDGLPILEAGENVISYSGGIANVTISPRWWTI